MRIRRKVVGLTVGVLLAGCSSSQSSTPPSGSATSPSASASLQLQSAIHEMVVGLAAKQLSLLCAGFKKSPGSVIDAFVAPLSATGVNPGQAGQALILELSVACR